MSDTELTDAESTDTESTDAESTDRDNNNMSPIFNPYIVTLNRNPYLVRLNRNQEFQNLQDDDSSSSLDSSSEFVGLTSSSTSDNDVVLNVTSESDDFLSEPDNMSNSTGTSAISEPLINEFNSGQISVPPIPKHNNNWCIPRELFNREIGNYKYHGTWSNKFYQSLVAVQKLKISRQLKGHGNSVNALDFNKTGDNIVSGSNDCRIRLWNWSTGKCLLKYRSIHFNSISQTKFLTTHDGGNDLHIVSSGIDGLVILSGVHNGDVNFSKTLACHNRSCNKVCVHPDLPNVVLSCGEDGFVKNIDIRESPIDENENILHIRNSNGSVMRLYGIDINPLKSFEFIVNGEDEYVRMFDKRNLRSIPVKIFHRASKATYDDDSSSVSSHTYVSHVTSALYNYCGTEILASYSNDKIYLFEVYESPIKLHCYSGHLNRATSVNFYGPRSNYVISGSDCGHIFMWDKKSEAIVLRKLADGNGSVNVVEAHPHVPTLATSGLDNTIKIWEPVRMSI